MASIDADHRPVLHRKDMPVPIPDAHHLERAPPSYEGRNRPSDRLGVHFGLPKKSYRYAPSFREFFEINLFKQDVGNLLVFE